MRRRFLISGSDQIPANEIWYTTYDGTVLFPRETLAFNVNLLNSSYNNGRGVMKFDGAVTETKWGAFRTLDNLQSIILPNTLTTIGDSSFMGSGIESIIFSNNLTEIQSLAFNNCLSLTNLNIPNSVIYIRASAFAECEYLKEVTIGESVALIEDAAFLHCDSLIKVYCKSLTPPTLTSGFYHFGSNYSNITFYVPYQSLNSYKTVWSRYDGYLIGYDFESNTVVN